MNVSTGSLAVAVLTAAIAAGAACSDTAQDALPPPGKEEPQPSPGAGPVPAGLPGAQLAAQTGLRRLTESEYKRTVTLLIDDPNVDTSTLPADARVPFDNDETQQTVSPAYILPLETLAEGLASKLVGDSARRDRIVGCKPSGPEDAACLRSFVTHFGRLALRRPLAEAEITGALGLLSLAKTQNDFYAAVEVFVGAMLQQPEFLYRVEVGTPVDGQANLARMNDFEVASRLSFLLLGRGPDDALLDLAAAGKLQTPQAVRNAAAELIAKPDARAQVLRFFQMWMGYEAPPHEKQLADAMRAESDALVAKVVVDENRPFQDIFRAKETFITPTLAANYGLPSPGPAGDWVPYGTTGRKGILSQGSLLSAGGAFGDTSPTQRGKWVRQRLMCQTVAPPPPGVIADEPPGKDTPNACKVQKYKSMATGSCAGCHALMDNIGFGLERFDGQGRFRATEPNRADCPLDGQGEVTNVGTFTDPAGLSDLLLQSGTVHDCAVVQFNRFTQGHTEQDASDTAATKILGDMRPGDFKMRDLFLDMVSAEAFLHRKLPL